VSVELLAPAGNAEKLSYVYRYGADAAYIGVRNFSLRARADNFHSDEFETLRLIKGEKKLYAAFNIYFHQSDLEALRGELDYIARYPLDAFIVSDLGASRVLKEAFPDIPQHLSTQANCINPEAAKAYRDLGFARIILGRETSLKEIAAVRAAVPDVTLEAFVHGAMCLAYSGRCFLSAWMADRSANEGNCSHSCRWQYRVLEESERPGEYYPLETGENFTTILSSKDLCMIDHLKELKEAGIDSFKIEGRMKSIYYAAVVTRAYRKALDALEGREDPHFAAYREELFNVSHREYSTGFYFGRDEIEIPTRKSYQRRFLFLGSIGKRVSKGEGLYALDVKNQIRSDDAVQFIGPDTPHIEGPDWEILDEALNPVKKADHGRLYYLQSPLPLEEGYILRKPIETK
jgi:U32 family peptidase